ncbi:MAG: 2-C-methyl-D-erythritol 2,4-cyclodiphosphate synthase [Candidatus Bruticola sp.]
MDRQEIISLIKSQIQFRTGLGFDVHQLIQGRPLILGGVNIPYELGLLGHSDADVLVHAVMDAILGAAKLADIGVHFPDTDERWKGADSLKLATAVSDLVRKSGYEIVNIDSIIVAQKPKMAPYFQQMAQNIAKALGIEAEQVSVKATTTEKMGFCGSGEGMAALASALLRRQI